MTNNDTAIDVQNINKIYRLGMKDKIHDSFAGSFFSFVKRPFHNYKKYQSLYNFDDVFSGDQGTDFQHDDIVWAVKDVSFEMKKGEVLGLIGGNGAGKSTLLKILSRITEPTSGKAEIHGRMSSLLEVGTGFHQELTGRENVYLNGTILGMKKREVDRKFDQIVDFSGIGRFIDTPVKRYSSGMRVRLAFSVAAFMEPEILLVDEVLAVGDVTFQKQCIGKMSEVAKEGRTIIFVSHNMATIAHLCQRVILLDKGQVRLDSEPEQAISEYFESMSSGTKVQDLAEVPRERDYSPIIQKIEIFNQQGTVVSTVQSGDNVTIHIHYKHSDILKDPHFGLRFDTAMGERIFFVQTKLQKGPLPDIAATGIIECTIPRLPLLEGTYFITVGCASRTKQLDAIDRAVQFQVAEADVFGTGIKPDPTKGKIFVDANWEVLQGG